MIESKSTMWLIAGGITLVAILVCIALTLLAKGGRQFPTAQAEVAHVHPDQCERLRSSSSVAEPQNTWSNFAYFIAGVLIVLRARSVAGVFLGANLCVLAFFSGGYHATLGELPQIMDVAWVYSVLMSLIVVGISAAGFQLKVRELWWLWIPLTIALMVFGFVMKRVLGWNSLLVFIGLVIVTLGVVVINVWFSAARRQISSTNPEKATIQFGGQWGWLYLTLELIGLVALTGIAAMFQLGDGYDFPPGRVTRDFLCNPDSAIQAHAVWHTLSAASLLLTYDVFAQFQQALKQPAADQTTVLPNLAGP